MTGALINTTTVLVGSTAGLALGARLPERFQRVALRVLGCITLVLGVTMLIQTRRVWVLALALTAGVITGTLLRLQYHLERTAQRALDRFSQPGKPSRIAEGFITTTLLFCVGPLTIIGSIQDGLTGDFHLIAVKALMDGVAACAFAATLGWGVLLSAGSVLIIQGGITLSAQLVSGFFTPPLVAELTAAGGALVLCIAVDLLGWKRLPVADYLPTIFFAPLLAYWLA